MDKKLEKKIVLSGPYEDVLSINDHFYISDKFYKICVLPYTISSSGILEKVGVIKHINILSGEQSYSLINDYINADDKTNLVGANRILFEIIGKNIKNAEDWMYLGTLNNISNMSKLIIYCVNISNIEIEDKENVEESEKARKFEMINSNKVVSSDDALFLATYLRLFNYFYINSIKI